MRVRAKWIAPVLLILSVAVLLLLIPGRTARVPLSDGTELRILKVTHGTNHLFSRESNWKQRVRRFLPDRSRRWWGIAPAKEVTSPHDILVIWVEQVHLDNGVAGSLNADAFTAVMPDGSVAAGHILDQNKTIVPIEFSRFARASRQVPLQMHVGTNVFPFTVDNPRPARAATWEAKPLPQTVSTRHRKFTLTRMAHNSRDRFRISVQARTPTNGIAGWSLWHATAFDSVGNWVGGYWEQIHAFAYLPTNNSPWKLAVKATEYLSAGQIPTLSQNSYHDCTLDERIRSLGICQVIAVNRGDYIITNGIVRLPADHLSTSLKTAVTGTNWSVRLATFQRGVVCVFDGGDPTMIAVRMRERIGANGGRVFKKFNSSLNSGTTNQTRITAAFFPVTAPEITTNLEVEVIATHPEVEFFVDPAAIPWR